jgi:hypothetical protein
VHSTVDGNEPKQEHIGSDGHIGRARLLYSPGGWKRRTERVCDALGARCGGSGRIIRGRYRSRLFDLGKDRGSAASMESK